MPLLVLTLLALAAGCTSQGAGEAPPEPAAGTEPTSDAGIDTVAAGGSDAICLRGEQFVASGRVLAHGGTGGTAPGVRGLRWEPYEGCERFVIDLGSSDAPAAAAGEVRVEMIRDLSVLRVMLANSRDVAVDATDAAFDGDIARGAYVVWAPDDRSTFVDVHLSAPAEAHATVLQNPARVVVDLRPGGGDAGDPPVAGERVVVLEPEEGSAGYPLRVTGYSRTFEANVVVRLMRDGRELHETFTTATAWVDAWGYYSILLDDGPTGPVTLEVGEYSARDGTWEGVSLRMNMR